MIYFHSYRIREKELTIMYSRKPFFPIIADDERLERDDRVVMTNQQLLTRNPSPQSEEEFKQTAHKASRGLSSTLGKNALKPKVTYNSQHRPLNSNDHSSANSFDKMNKKTQAEESRDRARRAAVPPARPRGYVHPLERSKEDVSVRKTTSTALNRKIANENPIQSMKNQGMNVNDALKTHEGARQIATPNDHSYFQQKRNNLFDRG